MHPAEGGLGAEARDAATLETTRMLLVVGLIALLVRLIHTQSLVLDPLFYAVLGGNAPYLDMAERIAGGRLLPPGAFTLNSPLYPYLVAVVYKTIGVGSLFAVRVVGALFDAGACALVALLAYRHFGRTAGWASGLVMAFYGPAIFFASELAPVSAGLFLILVAIVLLDGEPTARRFALAGVVLGLATGVRPNFVFAAALALFVPWTRKLEGGRALAVAILAGTVVGMAPVALTNLAASGHLTLLTLSGGHNLYIGHNPNAQAQYALPATLDGDIFATMKALAEEAVGRPMEPEEVSGYYTRKAIAGVLADPMREVRLTATRALLLVNDFEATTYANPYYQRTYSPLLRWAPTFAWLFALAVPGMWIARARRHWHLWIPLAVGAASVLGFFYIARLRVIVVPSLAIFAGVSVAGAVEAWRSRGIGAEGESAGVGMAVRHRVLAAVAAAVMAFAVAKIPLLRPDTSNEWNKAGGVLRVLDRPEEAEEAFARARDANPANPNTYFNLAVLYRQSGRVQAADSVEAIGRALAGAAGNERAAYLNGLRGRVP